MLAVCLLTMTYAALATTCTAQAQESTTPPATAAAPETPAEPATTVTEPAATTTEATTIPPATVAEPDPINVAAYSLDNYILMLCAVLVIFMQAGFALVETGLNASKNAVNIMFKNFMDFCVGGILFFIVGYGIMYPGNWKEPIVNAGSKVFSIGGIGIPSDAPEIAAAKFDPQASFLFQVAFAATAATIVSGSVAGRIKFASYIIYTAVISAIIYPVSGMWMWGGGWLFQMGFKDFAGSVVVHTVGGMAGLAGAIALGPRIGRYVNGKAIPMPGHNLPFVCLGVFILMIGWYGFNPGSQLAFTGASNVKVVMMVAVNTTLAGCMGGVTGMLVSWMLFKKPDMTFALNGTLAGLVGITANCHCVTNVESLLIGGIAGVIVIAGAMLLDKLQIDDPVGAFPVHGCCGMWGGIATGLFGDVGSAAIANTGDLSLTTQIIGTLSIASWALGSSLAMFYALKACGLLRVPAEEEIEGLDITEHGMYAYPPQLVVDAFPGARPPASGVSHGVTSPKPSHVSV
jgi:Amt family ammonium transporter